MPLQRGAYRSYLTLKLFLQPVLLGAYYFLHEVYQSVKEIISDRLIHYPILSSEEEAERTNMIKSLVRVKEVVGETAKQFNLSQKEVLRMASDQG